MANVFTIFVMLCVTGCSFGHQKSDDCKDKWKLVFLGISGNGKSVYNAFTRTQPNNCKLKVGCLPDNVKPGFLKHQRRHLTSPLVKDWSSLNINKFPIGLTGYTFHMVVKMELYKNGKVVVQLVFGAHGSTYLSWFSQRRLLQSSFHDLYKGHCMRQFTYSGISYHRFMISQDSTCLTNYDKRNHFWMAIVDKRYKRSKCPWSKQSSYPAFLYAPRGERAQFNKNKYRRADEMAIYISMTK